MRILTILVVSALLLGCSDKATSPADDDAPVQPDASGGDTGVQCLVCGEAPPCGEACTDVCGCCCTEGDERVENGGLERCTAASCWERVGEAPDMDAVDVGTPDMAVADVGNEDAGADVGPDMNASTCIKEPNAGSPPSDTCQHGGADWLAWQWIPDEDMTITELQMHTDEGFAALLADDGTRPGMVLAEGTLSAPDADGWRTLSVNPAVNVTGGTTYWLGEDVTTCSTVEDGTEFPYFTADSSAGPWSGPFMAHTFTARLAGTCP